MSDSNLSVGKGWNYAPAPEGPGSLVVRDRYDHFIGGSWVAPASGHYFESINPATEATLAEVASGNAKDIDLAVQAARKAYKDTWGSMAPKERGKYLFRIARLLQEHARELAVLGVYFRK